MMLFPQLFDTRSDILLKTRSFLFCHLTRQVYLKVAIRLRLELPIGIGQGRNGKVDQGLVSAFASE